MHMCNWAGKRNGILGAQFITRLYHRRSGLDCASGNETWPSFSLFHLPSFSFHSLGLSFQSFFFPCTHWIEVKLLTETASGLPSLVCICIMCTSLFNDVPVGCFWPAHLLSTFFHIPRDENLFYPRLHIVNVRAIFRLKFLTKLINLASLDKFSSSSRIVSEQSFLISMEVGRCWRNINVNDKIFFTKSVGLVDL